MISVACGDTHTIAMTADGKLYGFGRNQNGQLGLGTSTDQLHPTLIDALQVSHFPHAACHSQPLCLRSFCLIS